jgi:hypothetical protein
VSYLRNKPPAEPIVHFVRPGTIWGTMTSCGQHVYENDEPRPNICTTSYVRLVTCGSCVRTVEYKREQEKVVGKHEDTVGNPTQGSEDRTLERPINMGEVMTEASRMLGHNDSFGATQPAIHAMTKRGTPAPLCGDPMEHGYSTMDGGVVNCRDCLQHPEFIRRNNMFTEMMSPTLADGEREPIAQVHDREPVDDYGEPLYNHDCEACVYLGHKQGQDLYYCDQGGGPNMSTVIARRSDRGEDYISGLVAARQEELLALAVVRAFRKGLLTDDEMSWL